ncbi:hypothetical protein ONA70_22040 [Micromonospora yasonensis]|uniref:hypothetical protein n=1 Tax=Micromonospora yasonensis TaxID=1128667 RepID=UPI00222FF32D|nr:hypothetical protein [Micromonospora yasonensis]MCW3842785.1 hypothetical protein [Micromonospora yasonensis]
MSYQLSAVVADVELLREQTVDLDHAVLAALRQDFALLPVTPQLVEELTGDLPDFATDEPSAAQPFQLVLGPALTGNGSRSRRGQRPAFIRSGAPPSGAEAESRPAAELEFSQVLARWSRQGPVAYLEAEFAGGLGHQAAVVWQDGEVSWGPCFDRTLDRPRSEWPINAALARLGAEPGPWIDPFAELGLHLECGTAGWLAHGRRGLSADYWDELAEEWELRQSDPDQQPLRPGPVGDWGIA